MKTYGQFQHLTERGEGFYMTEYYDIQEFSSNSSCNLLARMRNLLVTAINKQMLLPKYILVVLEMDMCNECSYDDFGLSLVMGTNLKWIANEYHRLLTAYKDTLPEKAKKYRYPEILWVSPPRHALFNDNDKRKKYDGCLNGIAPLFPEMSVLRLKQKWEFNDGKLAVINHKKEYRITSTGISRYWEAIDGAVQYWDTRVGISEKPRFFIRNDARERIPSNDRFHWRRFNNRSTNYQGQRGTDQRDGRFTLPPPPKAGRF